MMSSLSYRSEWPGGHQTETILRDGLAWESIPGPGGERGAEVSRPQTALEARMVELRIAHVAAINKSPAKFPSVEIVAAWPHGFTMKTWLVGDLASDMIEWPEGHMPERLTSFTTRPLTELERAALAVLERYRAAQGSGSPASATGL